MARRSGARGYDIFQQSQPSAGGITSDPYAHTLARQRLEPIGRAVGATKNWNGGGVGIAMHHVAFQVVVSLRLRHLSTSGLEFCAAHISIVRIRSLNARLSDNEWRTITLSAETPPTLDRQAPMNQRSGPSVKEARSCQRSRNDRLYADI